MAINVHLTSETNYTEEATGYLEMAFEDWFDATWMTVISRDDNKIIVEAEWGDGDGFDTYEIELVAD